jgi:glycosyltransferase involved in cell wall biosynthesis
VALEAMVRLKDKEHELVIGGKGEEKENLIALSKKLGIARRVRFLGRIPSKDLSRHYAKAKLMLFTNKNEPFGMVPVEAMACGTPVVGVNSGGVKETVTHDYNGMLLDDMTPENLANVIDYILANSKKYASLKKNTRLSVEKFNWQQHVQRLETVLNDVLQVREKSLAIEEGSMAMKKTSL